MLCSLALIRSPAGARQRRGKVEGAMLSNRLQVTLCVCVCVFECVCECKRVFLQRKRAQKERKKKQGKRLFYCSFLYFRTITGLLSKRG